MDMNQPTTPPLNTVSQQPAAPTPLATSTPVAPAAQQASSWQEPPKQGGSHTLLIVALLVIIVAIAVGAYFFMSNQRTSETANGKTTYKQPIAQTQGDFTSLGNDANSIDVESNDSDFTDVDKNIQSL